MLIKNITIKNCIGKSFEGLFWTSNLIIFLYVFLNSMALLWKNTLPSLPLETEISPRVTSDNLGECILFENLVSAEDTFDEEISARVMSSCRFITLVEIG